MLNMNKFGYITALAICTVSLNVFAVSDADISSTVRKQIHASKVTEDSKIDVATKNGVVFLTGTVQTEGEASSAIETANSVAGVKDVNSDSLMVKNGAQPYEDAFITAKIKGAYVREKLFGDKPVDVSGISVETKDGVVYLTGTAATKAQAESAVSLAKEIKGVKGVESKVTVEKQ